jgi:hypothetical protein
MPLEPYTADLYGSFSPGQTYMGTYPVSHYGPPVMKITQLDDVVRKEFYEKKGVVLGHIYPFSFLSYSIRKT